MKKGFSLTAKILIGLVITVFILLVIGKIYNYKQVLTWSCSFTGSQKEYSKWFGLYGTNTNYVPSPIEKYLQNKNLPIKHNWHLTKIEEHDLYNKYTAEAEPPIISLFTYDYQEKFLKKAPQKVIDDTLAILLSNDEIEKSKKVNELMLEEIIKKTLPPM